MLLESSLILDHFCRSYKFICPHPQLHPFAPLSYGAMNDLDTPDTNPNDVLPAMPKTRRRPGEVVLPLKYTNDIVNL